MPNGAFDQRIRSQQAKSTIKSTIGRVISDYELDKLLTEAIHVLPKYSTRKNISSCTMKTIEHVASIVVSCVISLSVKKGISFDPQFEAILTTASILILSSVFIFIRKWVRNHRKYEK